MGKALSFPVLLLKMERLYLRANIRCSPDEILNNFFKITDVSDGLEFKYTSIKSLQSDQVSSSGRGGGGYVYIFLKSEPFFKCPWH